MMDKQSKTKQSKTKVTEAYIIVSGTKENPYIIAS